MGIGIMTGNIPAGGRKAAAGQKKRGGKNAGGLGFLFAVAMFSLLVPGCGKKKEDSVAAIRAAGVLRVALVNTDSSFTHMEGGTPAGQEPELVEYIAQALGVEAEYKVCDRQGALSAVTAGEADVALGCIDGSGSLSGEYLLSGSYGRGYLYAVTKRGDFVLTIGALADSALGVEAALEEGTVTQLYGAENVTVSDYSQASQAAQAIQSGEIRAYICGQKQAEELLEETGLQVQNVENLEPEEYVIVAEKSDQTLVSGINTLIRQFLEGE